MPQRPQRNPEKKDGNLGSLAFVALPDSRLCFGLWPSLWACLVLGRCLGPWCDTVVLGSGVVLLCIPVQMTAICGKHRRQCMKRWNMIFIDFHGETQIVMVLIFTDLRHGIWHPHKMHKQSSLYSPLRRLCCTFGKGINCFSVNELR